MAEGTRFRKLDEVVKTIGESTVAQGERIDALQTMVSELLQTLAELVVHVTTIDGRLEQGARLHSSPPDLHTPSIPQSSPSIIHPPSTASHPPNLPSPIHTRTVRLDFPRFDGVDPAGWIFKAERFFAYHGTTDDQCLLISSFHMDGPALQWFQWMFRKSQFPSWDVFIKSLEVRFGPSEFEDPQGALSKLTQTSTVAAYQSQFELLANRTEGASSAFLLSCFTSGLSPMIRCEVMSFRPTSMAQAVGCGFGSPTGV